MLNSAPERLRHTPSWLLTQIAARAGRMSRDVFDAARAGRYHYAILAAVEQCGPCSQAEVGRRLRMDRKDVAQRVAELEAEGFIARGADPADPRRNHLLLTARGADRLEEIHSRLAPVQDELLQSLSPDERAVFIRSLQAVLDGLTR